MDPAFAEVGSEPGLKVWRIENFQVCSYDESLYGQFYDGDCYIVLKTTLKGNTLDHHVHFWIGAKATQDESGTAAIKTVELDDALGGAPVQHREVQEHESSLFTSYFPKGIKYLQGGVASGFRHVDPDDYEPALFQVKGRFNIRAKQVEMSVSSLNQGDCFILDTAHTVFVFTGRQSSSRERLSAIQAATGIRDNEHAGSAKILILDETAEKKEFDEFFELLGGGSMEDVTDVSEDDSSSAATDKESVTLYKVTDGGAESIAVDKLDVTPLSQTLLTPGDSFILRSARCGLYVWIGKESSSEERVAAMKHAVLFLQQHNLPTCTKVERVVQYSEPTVFKQYFSDWQDENAQTGLGNVHTINRIADALGDVDLESRSPAEKQHLVEVTAGGALGFLPDDGSGSKEIFRVENMELEPVPDEKYGMFFGGDSYVIKYSFTENGRQQHIIYMWQGRESSQDEKAAAAIHAVKMDSDLGGKAVQIRVTQGHEPRHFLLMFGGKMVVYLGGHASGFRNVREHETYSSSSCRLYQLLGLAGDRDARAVQLPASGDQLLEDRVLLLDTEASCFSWRGQESCAEEQALVHHFATILTPGAEPIAVVQGEEPPEFLEALDGAESDGPSAIGGRTQRLHVNEMKLLHCRIDSAGRFQYTEVQPICQQFLNEGDVMVLDTGDEIYSWIGKDASRMEQDKSFQVAQMLLNERAGATDGAVIQVKQAHEPHAFKQMFSNWDDDMFQNQPKLDDIKSLIQKFNE